MKEEEKHEAEEGKRSEEIVDVTLEEESDK